MISNQRIKRYLESYDTWDKVFFKYYENRGKNNFDMGKIARR